MARFEEPTARQARQWAKWVRSRQPPAVRAVAERFDPWTLYRMGDQRVVVKSFSVDGTITVLVTGRFNQVLFDREVFGVNPDDLEPCDLPGPDEVLGSQLDQQEVGDNIDALRVMVRPDLWIMGPDGKAVRRQ